MQRKASHWTQRLPCFLTVWERWQPINIKAVSSPGDQSDWAQRVRCVTERDSEHRLGGSLDPEENSSFPEVHLATQHIVQAHSTIAVICFDIWNEENLEMRKSAAGMETAGQALTRGNLWGLSSQSSLSSDPRLGLPLRNGVKSDCCSACV